VSATATLKRSFALGRLGIDLIRARRHAGGAGQAAARRLVASRMGRLRGLPQKIGQIISLGEFDDASEFSALTDAAEPVPSIESFAWIARELGRPIDDVFAQLDPHGAAASLGQVHRGQLHDGRSVAVKIQFPFIRESLDADLAALGWLAAPLSAHRSGFSVSAYRDTMRTSLLGELDYVSELAALSRFHARTGDVPGIVTPMPVAHRCTPQLLTMSWVDGVRVQEAARWPAADRYDAALAILRFFLRGCFAWGEVHADPHAGNLRFQRTAAGVSVGILDFGCVKTLSQPERNGLWRLAHAGRELTPNDIYETYVAMGFDEALLAPMASRLPAVTAVLFEPFHTEGPYDLSSWKLSERLAAVLGDDRWNFRFAGPASMLFLIRAFQGVAQYVRTFDAALDWRRELQALTPNVVATTDQPSLNGSNTPMVTEGTGTMRASKLRLEVVRDGEVMVQLSFPATSAAHLPDLVPEELAERVGRLDLASLATRTVEAGFPPGDLLTLNSDGKTVRVWLE